MVERPSEPMEAADPTGQSVLVIDDEPSLRHLLQYHLAREGRRVLEAAAAGEALSSAEHHQPDLVLLDLQLPEADGLELLLTLRERLPDVPVIALTSPDDPAAGVEALRRGAHDLVEKPFDVPRLEIAVRNALRMRRLSRQVAMLSRELGASEARPAAEALVPVSGATGLRMTPPAHRSPAHGRGGPTAPPPVTPLEEIEREHILRAIESCGGNLSQAARLLDIGRTTLYRKLQRYGATSGDGSASPAYL